MINFEGKNILVTGAAGAIGKGIAEGFRQYGGNVFLSDLKQEGVDAAIAEITPAGTGLIGGLAGNVTVDGDVQKVVQAAAGLFNSKIDILVNVAGIVGQAKVEEITEEEWDRIFDVNCKGTWLYCKYVVPMMKAQKFGRIINFSSKSGKTGSALMSHYSAAKGAVISFTHALAYELADNGITANCLCPGITEDTGVWSNVSAGYIKNLGKSRDEVVKQFSAKIPLKRLAKIKDVVSVTLFMASSGADYLTGQAINVDGGREMH